MYSAWVSTQRTWGKDVASTLPEATSSADPTSAQSEEIPQVQAETNACQPEVAKQQTEEMLPQDTADSAEPQA
eukprot:NODE_4334_length_351_cov_253.476821_g3733_i0.p2 GENE.NODE_4334_length_351_cov_253.476821_g3733_i0~~NODE_4334_length_351_cov_253.476821_g3733_i0.p2  ORF type:complete len:73 (+),score=17.56 NODE_4334_length_351_cov_253.476821_g3733_i0:23-241(+)